MKSSESHVPDLDLPQPTPADIEALRRRPGSPPATFESYFRFLASLGEVDSAALRARRLENGPEPFTLP